MRVIVCGGRNWTDATFVFNQLDAITPAITYVIEGGQRTFDKKTGDHIGGCDFWANTWATMRGIEVHTEWAHWKQYGRPAGPMRNTVMLDMKPEKVIAFPGGKGTRNMVMQARKAGVEVIEIVTHWNLWR